jgi:hypothetical protein
LIYKKDQVLLSNVMLCIALLIGTIVTALIRSPLRRQEAQQTGDVRFAKKSSITIVSPDDT